MTDTSGTPIKITPLQRAMAEAEGFAARGDFDVVPPSDAALKSLASEFKTLRKKVTILYAATTLGAFLILSQTPDGASVSLMGVSIPLALLSKQALSILLVAAFAYYAGDVISASMVYGTMAAILKRSAPESWEFLLSRYDADQLWTNMLTPKKLGAPSPTSERILAWIVAFANKAVVGGHIALVWGAVVSAMLDALDARSFFGIALSALALLAVICTTIGALCAAFKKLTYTIPAQAETP
jgi:hypothetical protein